MSDDTTGGRAASDRPATGREPGRSRRRFLALATAGIAAAGVAGCTTTTPADGSDGGGDGSDSPGGGSDGGGDGSDSPGGGSDGSGDGSDGGATPTETVARPLEDWAGYDPDWEPPTSSPLEADLEAEVLVENLEIPWDLSFAPDGSLFITERVGRVLQFDGGEVRTVAEPEEAIDAGSLEPGSDERPWWVKGGEGGTLGIAVHPRYPDPAHVFVYYTYRNDEDTKYNKVAAFDVEGDEPGTPVRTVVDGIPANNYHNGGRVTFGPRNHLWITCGDGGERGKVQDLSSYAGKILRVTPEGEPAPGNPEYEADDADRRVFSHGHRNPQGVVWLPDGTPINSEHGPTGYDEINRLVPGDDYGWDAEGEAVRRPEQYRESDVHPPLFTTGNTSFAPTGSLFYTGEKTPALGNRMITGGLISQQLIVTTLTPAGGQLPPSEGAYAQVTGDWADGEYTATVHTMFENELGRVRHVDQGPEGDIYVCTSNRDGRANGEFPREIDDVLVRIRPA